MKNLFGKKKKAEEELSFEEKLTDRTHASGGGIDLVGTFSEEKKKRYATAMEKKAILFDKEDDEGVDYTHMDFVLSTGCGFYRGMTNLQAIKLFWKAFYPYLKTLADSYERFYDRFREIIDDQEDVLKTHAELDFKWKWTVQYLKEKGLAIDHQKFLEAKVEEAVNRHKDKEVKRASGNLPEVKEK